MIHFARTALAKELALALSGRSILGDAHNGLFLAAPRRTGKSTFLQRDLLPELEAQGVVVVYVDLWADQKRDPGDLIAEGIAREIDASLGTVAKFARKSGLDSVTVAGAFKIDTTKIGKVNGATLTDALRALHELAKKPIALIIDEAQHALTSAEGENAMTALKSARDQLNSPGKVSLMLVMSGSDRDKLLRLVNTNSAPFFGSDIKTMPMLGDDFVEHLATVIESERRQLAPIDRARLIEAFAQFGKRPQFFMNAIDRALSPLSTAPGLRFEARLLYEAKLHLAEQEAQMESDFLSLKPLDQAVVWRVLEQGARFKPYDASALAFYKSKTGKAVTPAQAQAVLERLRQRSPAYMWKSERGEYALDDVAMHQWYQHRVDNKTWPPVP